MSKYCDMYVVSILRFDSAKVLPKQTRLPPRNGVKAKVFLFLPSGAKESSLELSQRSGKNSLGRFQWALLWCTPYMFT